MRVATAYSEASSDGRGAPAASAVELALADAERKGFRLAVIGRTGALVAIAVFYLAALSYPSNIYVALLTLAISAVGLAPLALIRQPVRAHRTLRPLRLRRGGHQRHACRCAAHQRRRGSSEPGVLHQPPRILLPCRGGLGPGAIARSCPLDRPLRRDRSRRRHGLDHGGDGARRRPRRPAAVAFTRRVFRGRAQSRLPRRRLPRERGRGACACDVHRGAGRPPRTQCGPRACRRRGRAIPHPSDLRPLCAGAGGRATHPCGATCASAARGEHHLRRHRRLHAAFGDPCRPLA